MRYTLPKKIIHIIEHEIYYFQKKETNDTQKQTRMHKSIPVFQYFFFFFLHHKNMLPFIRVCKYSGIFNSRDKGNYINNSFGKYVSIMRSMPAVFAIFFSFCILTVANTMKITLVVL